MKFTHANRAKVFRQFFFNNFPSDLLGTVHAKTTSTRIVRCDLDVSVTTNTSNGRFICLSGIWNRHRCVVKEMWQARYLLNPLENGQCRNLTQTSHIIAMPCHFYNIGSCWRFHHSNPNTRNCHLCVCVKFPIVFIQPPTIWE